MPKTILEQRALDNFLGFKKDASGQLHSKKKSHFQQYLYLVYLSEKIGRWLHFISFVFHVILLHSPNLSYLPYMMSL